MSDKDLENIVNTVYPGLTHYVRDVDLDKSLIDKYKVGDIIYERAFTDVTNKIGKPIKSVRYSICSTQAVELNQISDEVNNEWGLCVINRDAAFKVLDIYEYKDKTLITLLNIPLEYVDIFKQLSINVDEDIVKMTRKRFEECYDSEPIKELDDDWYKRLLFPLGMSDDGVLFDKPNNK